MRTPTRLGLRASYRERERPRRPGEHDANREAALTAHEYVSRRVVAPAQSPVATTRPRGSPSETKSAATAMTSAGLGMRRPFMFPSFDRFTMAPSSPGRLTAY
jgi:hypothetical protein